MNAFIASRWFALFDLGCALLSGSIWYAGSQGLLLAFLDGLAPNQEDHLWLFLLKGGWPLLIALLPWLARIGVGHSPFKKTRFDLPLVVFLATAGVGIWAAYDRDPAWAKFWVLTGAVFLYYALAAQPRENLWLIAGMLGLLGAALGAAFLLWQDFQEQYTDLDIMRPVVQAWMSARPSFLLADLPPNIVGGLLAILAPFPLASGLAAWRARWIPGFLVSAFVLALIGFALLLTSSRGAWIALLVSLAVWAFWALSGRAAYRFPLSQGLYGRFNRLLRTPAFTLAFLLAATAILGLVLAQAGFLFGLADRFPGLPTGSSRFDLARNSLYLVADFPFTGGGLAAFAGLYSQYLRAIPFYLFGYSHNFFLDVAIEQGVPGLLALSAIFLGSVFLLAGKRSPEIIPDRIDLLQGAVLAGLVVAGVHGLGDDALYSGMGTPAVFLLPGLAVALRGAGGEGLVNGGTNPGRQGPNGLIIIDRGARSKGFERGRWALAGIVGLMAVMWVAYGWKPALSGWYANLGAVQMARAELAGFPFKEWDVDRVQEVIESSGIRAAVKSFDRSMQLNPNNATARFRMGLISIGHGDFETAVLHLETAHRAVPGHRGVVKVLGYAYVWTGQAELAMPLLNQIPEAQSEMDVFSWWWKERGREDLANQSAHMAALLANADHSYK